MFQPNQTGKLKSRIARTVHGTAVLGAERECPFSIVNLEIRTQKTSVRADSSGSRGMADEIASDRLKILIPAYVIVQVADEFSFDGARYTIVTKHPRRSIFGDVDHFECDLEVLP